MFGSDEVLLPAKALLGLPGIAHADVSNGTTYMHLMFDHHEIVISNGAETESLYLGPMALQALGPTVSEEIYAIFPDLRDCSELPPGARPFITGKEARKLTERHLKNNKVLVSPELALS